MKNYFKQIILSLSFVILAIFATTITAEAGSCSNATCGCRNYGITSCTTQRCWANCTGHTYITEQYVTNTQVVTRTCTRDGYTMQTIQKIRRCTDANCGLTEVISTSTEKINIQPATGHNWSSWTNYNDSSHSSTCKNTWHETGIDGSRTKTATHTYGTTTYTWNGFASCKASRDCTVCYQAQAETANSTNTITKPATCTEIGTKTYTVTFTNPAFTKQTKTEAISITSHTEVIDAAKEATCTETGLTEGKHCSVCNKVLVAQEEIPATGHILDERKCINCDYVDEIISATGKNESNEDINLSISIYDNSQKEIFENELVSNKMIENKKILEMFNVTSDDFTGKASVVFDVKYLAKEGDKITVFHYDKNNSNWENLGEYTVDSSMTITCDFTSFSPVVLAVEDNETEENDNVASTDANCMVYAEIGNEFTITIPKSLTLSGQTKSGTYTVSVSGDVAGTDIVKVLPDASVTMKQTGKDDVIGTITQNKTEWTYSEFNIVSNGTITALDLSAGKWEGTFNFNISLDGNKFNNSQQNVEYKELTF